MSDNARTRADMFGTYAIVVVSRCGEFQTDNDADIAYDVARTAASAGLDVLGRADIVCGWCKTMISEGERTRGGVSHGICAACSARLLGDALSILEG